MPQKYSSHFKKKKENKTGENRFCYIILSGLLSHYKSCTLAGRMVVVRAYKLPPSDA